MRKFPAAILLFISTALLAQQDLHFDKRFVQSEDKWVAFAPKNGESEYIFGFIYIDGQAGLTFNYEGRFTISADNKFIAERPLATENTSMKVRLEPNQVRVAHIPESHFAELGIPAIPDWLQAYKTDTNSVQRLYRWGFLYNLWDESEKAMTYLRRARDINVKHPGVEFELGFAFNALGQYDSAITILHSALATTPNEYLLYKELSFAQLQLKQLDSGALSARRGIALSDDSAFKAEMAYNVAYEYYKRKDRPNFSQWAGEALKWTKENDPIAAMLRKMGAQLQSQ